jgi:hypothetical protein
MRKIILMMPASGDGFIGGPERELDGHKVDDELHRQFNEQPGISGSLPDAVSHPDRSLWAAQTRKEGWVIFRTIIPWCSCGGALRA